MGGLERSLQLLALDPGLGGVITVGFQLEGVHGLRIMPHGRLTGQTTPWGWQPGMLDAGGHLVANLDLLPDESQAILAQRLDQGGCTLVASCSAAPWSALADRVAFLVGTAPPAWEPSPRPIRLAAAVGLIAAAASLWGVSGHRAEEFCLRTVLAIARASGRRRLQLGDVHEALALVLAPRARVTPEPARPEAPSDSGFSHGSSEAPPLGVVVPLLPSPPVQVREALHGAVARTVAGRRRRGTLDLVGTLLTALPWQRLRCAAPPPLVVRPQDLRWHLHRPRVGRLVIFLVDCSGSMGARRLGQAKGAVLQYLQEAYRRRDRVALIAAGGATPRLLLPPARAVEQARRGLVSLPAGGGTPLSGALLMAHRLGVEALRRESRPTLMLAMTDGRANQPLPGGNRATVREELKRCCLLLRGSGISPLVLGEPGPEAREFCAWLGAPLHSLYAGSSLTGTGSLVNATLGKRDSSRSLRTGRTRS